MRDDKNCKKSTAIAILQGEILSVTVTILIFVVCAVIMTVGNGFSDKEVSIIVYVTSAVAVAVGALKATSEIESGGLPKGLLVAVVYVALIVLAGFFTTPDYRINAKTIITLIFSLLSGAIGGIIGINLKKR